MLAPRPYEPLDRGGRRKVWLLVALAAALVTLSHHPANVPGTGFVAWVPLFWALSRLRAGGAFVAGLLFGAVNFGVNTWWLGQMASEPGKETMIFLIYVLEVLVLSVKQGLGAMIVRWLLTRQASWAPWLAPPVWIGVEMAAEIEFPATFPWLTSACGVSQFPAFLQMADITGAYGVGLCVLLINLAIAAQIRLEGPAAAPRTARGGMTLACAALTVLVAGFAYGAVRIGQVEAAQAVERPLVGLVQGNLPQEVKVARDPGRLPISFRQHLELSRQAAAQGADLICWAETMVYGGSTREGLSPHVPPVLAERYFENGLPKAELLDNIARDTGYIGPLRADIRYRIKTPMLVGAITPVPKSEQLDERKDYSERTYNAALLFDAQGRYVDSYDKRDLVPGGEYIPHEDNPLFQLVVSGVSRTLQNAVSRVEQGRRATVFDLPPREGRRPWRFTTSICYEFAFADGYVSLHRPRQGEVYPDFHVNISNEGWFKDSAELDQAVTFCRLRCIESRMPMVRATNTGITCVIDAAGRVTDVLTVDGRDRQVQGLLMARPPVLQNPAPTFFISHVGRIPAWISLATAVSIMGLMAAGRVLERRARKQAGTDRA